MPFPGEVEAKRLYPESVANFNSGLKVVRDWFHRSILCFVVFQKFAPVDKYYTFNVG